MSYSNNTKPEWRDNDYDDSYSRHQPPGSSPQSSPFKDDRRQDSYSSSTSGPFHHQDKSSSDYRSPSQHHHDLVSQGHDDDNDQYPVGRPLSYFPTHHQPLSQQEYDDEQQRTGNYHQMAPLQNAPSPLSSRQEWTYQGGYHTGAVGGGGSPPSDIPLVGIDIVSSNLEATRQGTQYSDTRTTENMSPHNGDTNSVYTAAGGVGNSQNQQYGQHNNTNYGQGQDHALPALPPNPNSNEGQFEGQYPGGEPIPKVLLDPKVQRQLNNRKVWRPWFVWIISAVQIGVLIYEIIKGYQRTGRIIETQPFNPMIGPGTGVSYRPFCVCSFIG